MLYTPDFTRVVVIHVFLVVRCLIYWSSATTLAFHLTGPAEVFYYSLPPSIGENYEALNDVLLEKYFHSDMKMVDRARTLKYVAKARRSVMNHLMIMHISSATRSF